MTDVTKGFGSKDSKTDVVVLMDSGPGFTVTLPKPDDDPGYTYTVKRTPDGAIRIIRTKEDKP